MFGLKFGPIEDIVNGRISTAAQALFVEKYGPRLSSKGSVHDRVFQERCFLWTLPLAQIREIVAAH